VIYLSDGDDGVELVGFGASPAVVHGGPGRDEIDIGPPLTASESGGSRASARRPGRTILSGGAGNDAINQFGFGWSYADTYPPESCLSGRTLVAALIVGGSGEDWLCDTPGDDTIRARDDSIDFIGCTGGADRVKADFRDYVGGRCEAIRRGRPAGAVPLGIDNVDPDGGGEWRIGIGCQADGPAPCRGRLVLSERTGRRVLRRQFRGRRGAVTTVSYFPTDAVWANADAHGIVATVVSPTTSGARRRVARLLPVPEPYYGSWILCRCPDR
jgi:hypothetical protein